VVTLILPRRCPGNHRGVFASPPTRRGGGQKEICHVEMVTLTGREYLLWDRMGRFLKRPQFPRPNARRHHTAAGSHPLSNNSRCPREAGFRGRLGGVARALCACSFETGIKGPEQTRPIPCTAPALTRRRTTRAARAMRSCGHVLAVFWGRFTRAVPVQPAVRRLFARLVEDAVAKRVCDEETAFSDQTVQ